MQATRIPRQDHRLIASVLDCFDDLLIRVREEGMVPFTALEPYLEFFREFVEGCHAEVEEAVFAALEAAGQSTTGTPVAAILEEHDAWGGPLDALVKAAKGSDVEAVASAGEAFAAFVRRHAGKEEHCVFPACDLLLQGEALESLSRSIEEITSRENHAGIRARCEGIAAAILADRGIAPPRAAPSLPPTARLGHEQGAPLSSWRLFGTRSPVANFPELADLVEAALASPAMALQVERLLPLGSHLVLEPMLWSFLPEGKLRLFFPVRGGAGEGEFAIEAGQVVALVLLHDIEQGETMYVHPVHAGPGTNPLLRYLDGPMSKPRAQSGANGELATRRILEHKIAIWDAFQEERLTLGEEDAGKRWRERYEFSLIHLYFCEKCTGCSWGSPFLSGVGDWSEATEGDEEPAKTPLAAGLAPGVLQAIHGSEAYRIEKAYASRGGFTIQDEPCFEAPLADEWIVVGFPSDVELIQAGSIAGLLVHHHLPSGETRYAQCLIAGPEAEITAISSRPLLDLPSPGSLSSRKAYASRRRGSWSRFWLVELEEGIRAASDEWIRDLWTALKELFGSEGESREQRSPQHARASS